VQEDLLKPGDPNYRQFHKILEAFRIPEPEELETKDIQLSVSQLVAQAVEKGKNAAVLELDSSSDEEKDQEVKQMSKKKLRKLNRLTVAQLKQLVERPDVVEMHDVTAMDPKLLIHLKVQSLVIVTRYISHW
jgi:splicing factor 3B subunit 2